MEPSVTSGVAGADPIPPSGPAAPGIPAEFTAGTMTGRARRPGLPHVPALDGIRALAVLAVLAYHGGVSWLPGGFLGVDVFFVLSGFLITTILLQQFASRRGRPLGEFWKARARRLLPALVLLIVAVALVNRFAMPPGSQPDLRSDSFASLFYVANWHFIAQGANYFAATGTPSLLTHTWSLSVEEQFYLVWPILVLVVIGRTRKVRTLLGWTLGLAAASAVEMAVLFTAGANRTRLYYGTDTHSQGIMLGAALACAMALMTPANARAADPGPRASRVPAHVRALGALGWCAPSPGERLAATGIGTISLAALIWLCATLRTSGSEMYLGGITVASLATVGLVYSLLNAPRSPLATLLSSPPMRFVGSISYGLYLWHYPVFSVLTAARTGATGAELFALRTGVSFVVAMASYRFVEQPIRRGQVFRLRRGALSAVFAVAMSAVVIVATTAVPERAALAANSSGGGSGVRVLVVGDSMAQTLANGLTPEIAAHYGVQIVNDGDPNCSLAMGVFRVKDYAPRTSAPACQPGTGDPLWPTDWRSEVQAVHPQAVVFLARLDIVDRLFDGRWTHIGDPAYDAYLRAQMELAVSVLSSSGARVVFLTTPYYDTGEQPDGAPWPEDDPQRVDEYNAMLRSVADGHPGTVSVVDLHAIADPGGRFASVIDGVDVRFSDGIHWTAAGDAWLAPRLLPEIRRAATG